MRRVSRILCRNKCRQMFRNIIALVGTDCPTASKSGHASHNEVGAPAGIEQQRILLEKPETKNQATSDPTSSTNRSRNHRRKSTQRRSRTLPPASRPCHQRLSPPCTRSSAASPGNHDRCPAVTLPPEPPRLRIELPSPIRMPIVGEGCAGQHDSGEPLSLRPRQAAARLGVSVSTLDRLTRAEKISRLTIGRIVLYRVETLLKWLENHET